MTPARYRVRHPGVSFPPPLLLVACFLLGLAAERWVLRVYLSPGPLRSAFVLAGWAAAAFGLCVAAWGLVTFFRASTAVMPNSPARRLVTWGPYRFSRNPMYVGLSALYVGLCSIFDLTWPIVTLPFGLAALYLLVIRREERYLADAFGPAYVAYRARVRRWI